MYLHLYGPLNLLIMFVVNKKIPFGLKKHSKSVGIKHYNRTCSTAPEEADDYDFHGDSDSGKLFKI